jgi:hypothetical protein
MTQPALDFSPQPLPRFDGADVTASDMPRLWKGLQAVKAFLSDGQWHTVAEIARVTQQPENSAQANCRNLRKEKFGAHDVQRKRVGNLTFYRLGSH